jgi:hypothetical protein
MKQVTSRFFTTTFAAVLTIGASGAAVAQMEGNAAHTAQAGDLRSAVAAFAVPSNRLRSDVAATQLEGNRPVLPGKSGVTLESAVNHSWIAPAQDHRVRVPIGVRGVGVMADSSEFPRVQM